MRIIAATFLSVLLIFSLSACGEKQSAPEPPPPETPVEDPGASTTVIPPESGDITLSGDSYWVMETSGGDDRLTDLTLWADGTARIREIEDGIRLVSDGDEQNMLWTCAADGSLSLYTAYSDTEPFRTGTVKHDGTLELERFGGTCIFQQKPMPEGGALYSPAELQGVWFAVSSSIEGDEEDLSGTFNTLVFETDWSTDEKPLVASAEGGGDGYITREDEFSFYQDRELTLLDWPIYSGCGNEVWSVRIGEESPLNEYDFPENVETYVTLLDRNTLLQQRYFSFDNGSIPGVSYQTYKRFLPEASYGLEKAELVDRDFELSGYMDADGTWHATHPEFNRFTLRLEENAYYFHMTGDGGLDYLSGGGYWEMGRGGTLHMTSESNDADWLCGAVQCSNEVPEIYLWNQGNILRLTHTAGSSGEWDGYVDTMNDLEGRAFAAPENTLFVLYNQNHTDLTKLHSLPFYEIDEGAEAQYVLVTSVIDGNYFWLDEDGFCREDFGTVDAGESFVFKVNLPESGGYLLQIESSLGDYFIELTQNLLPPNENWNYFTT